jgi:16S rRNA (adenine(1408)-N(1))-methyltransferase
VTIDLGTGDGRLPFTWAARSPGRLFVGLDASAAGLRELSGRAQREGRPNLLYVRAGVEDLPAELEGVADRVVVVLPWGSLLAAVARPSIAVLARVRALCRPGAALAVVLGIEATRDRSEIARLQLPALTDAHLRGPLADAYRNAGFTVISTRRLEAAGLRAWPSTWSRRLFHAPGRGAVQIDARAV